MKKLLILFIVFAYLAYGRLEGRGKGSNEREAIKNALYNLSSQIQVQVKGNYFSKEVETESSYSLNEVTDINLITDNLLLGVDITTEKISFFKKDYLAVAVINLEKLPLYYNKLKEVDEKISENFQLSKDSDKSRKLIYIEKAIEESRIRDKYSYIIYTLGGIVPEHKIRNFQLERQRNIILEEIERKKNILVSVFGNIEEQERTFLQRELSSGINGKKILVKYTYDGNEDYYIDVSILEFIVRKLPETFVMPEMTSVKINGIMEVINSKGEVIFSQNIIGASEEMDEREAIAIVMNLLKDELNKNIVNLLGEEWKSF